MYTIKVIENGDICSVQGFLACGVTAGIKKIDSTKKDIALIFSEKEAISAGVFTTNKVRSKTVDISRDNIKKSNTRAIIINSGNANACVGKKGYDDALEMTKITAKELALKEEEVLVSSTGVIGKLMPMDRIIAGIEKACKSLKKDGGREAAQAIMTTDLTEKKIAVEFQIEEGKFARIGGIAKGSGMIHPNMATMLGYITTDVNIEKTILQELLSDITNKTFNMISVDRDTSTNDSLILLSNGLCENEQINNTNTLAYEKFRNALYLVMEHLAKEIAKDGEGATKLIEVNVVNASTQEDAIKVSKSIITSPLVKTAINGEDANWGRIICAVGYSGAELNEGDIDIKVGNVKVCENGMGILEDEEEINKELKKSEIVINIDLKYGKYSAKSWGCDLSYEYVKINADYRS